MSLKAKVRSGLGFARRVIRYRSLSTALLVDRNKSVHDVEVRPGENGRIVVDKLGITLDPKKHDYYLPLLWIGRDLLRFGVGKFAMDENGDPEFRTERVRITPRNRDDLFIIEEIFARRLYEMYDERQDWFVWDVGMNVGVSALYFAGEMGWEVIAYEPFPTTYELARQNIERNDCRDRVHTRQKGVDAKAGTLTIPFNEESRSTNSLYGNLAEDRATEDRTVTVEVVDAADALEEALAMAGDRPLLAKIDCEGAEYGIIERLIERGLLERVEAFMIEYHFILPEHTAERIRKPLVERGYFLKTLWLSDEAEGVLAVRVRR